MVTHLFNLPTGVFVVVSKDINVTLGKLSEDLKSVKVAIAKMPSGCTYVNFYGDKNSSSFKTDVETALSNLCLDMLGKNLVFADMAPDVMLWK